MSDGRRWEKTACPSCGVVALRLTYDIGEGPELACAECEWCWGADGQPLTVAPFKTMWEELEQQRRHDTD